MYPTDMVLDAANDVVYIAYIHTEVSTNKTVLTSWDISTKTINWGMKPGLSIQRKTMKLTPTGTFLFFTDFVDQFYKMNAATGAIVQTYVFALSEILLTLDINPSGTRLFVGGGFAQEGHFSIINIGTNTADI
jgi:hypothetical protein